MAAAFVLVAGSSMAADMHWSYTGEAAPAHWSELDPAYEMCAKGMNQSPIDLTGFVEADLAPITF
ncbi:MAG: carbonic anhydrase, partial [Desulfobulbus sp.]